MNGKLIVICGYLAAGKSTFARDLSGALGVPCLVKDTFKSAICTSIAITNRPESSRFSAVTFDAMIYVAERLLAVGYPLIIEGNFVPAGVKPVDEAGVIRSLVAKYQAQTLTFQFYGDTGVLFERFIEREKSPERGQANRAFAELAYEDFDKSCRNLDAFSIGGRLIKVDTTIIANIDFPGLIEEARRFVAPI